MGLIYRDKDHFHSYLSSANTQVGFQYSHTQWKGEIIGNPFDLSSSFSSVQTACLRIVACTRAKLLGRIIVSFLGPERGARGNKL